jgi:hypothetical protein
MKQIAKEIIEFFKGHWIHVLIGIPGCFVFTIFHELAHCVAAWVQGGRVIEFAWLPSDGAWGHMRYEFDYGMAFSDRAVSIAPYLLWTTLCLIAFAVSFKRKPLPFWASSTVFVWFFLAPLADTANAAMPQLADGGLTDLGRVFGPPSLAVTIGFVTYAVAMAIAGYFTQKQLYRERSISLPTYMVLGLIAAILVGLPML